MEAIDPAEGLYHFFLMGLAWLRADKPDRLACRGASVFSAFALANPVFKEARRLAPQSWDLRDLLLRNSIVHSEKRRPSRRELQQLIAESDALNIIVLPVDEAVAYQTDQEAATSQDAEPPVAAPRPESLFGPMGCSHVITDAGISVAMEVAGQYSEIISATTYLEGWNRHKTQMRNFSAKHRTSPSASGHDSEIAQPEAGGRYIPPARINEDDFDW